MRGKTGSLGAGSSSPLLPMFRASVASAPPNFLTAGWLTNTNHGASRSSLSTIDSEGIKEKDASPERSATSESHKEHASESKSRRDFWGTTGEVDGQWHSLESLSRILCVVSLVCFSIGAGLTIVGFVGSGLPLNATLLLQILGPVLLATALVTFLLGSVLGRLWRGEWRKSQLEMESMVRMKLEKLTREILTQQQQQRLLSYPQHQQLLSQLSSKSSTFLESIPLDVEAGVAKIAKRSRFFTKRGSLVNVSSTETTTANSRRSSRLATNGNGSNNQVDAPSAQGRDSINSVLLRKELERRLDSSLVRKTNIFPSFDLPGIQISRIETLDLDQASGSSCCSAKRYIIVHSDVASSDFSFASEYSLLSTARSRSRSRSSNASLFDFSPRDSEWDADVSLGSHDSQTSIAGRSSISGRELPLGFARQYYHFHRASCSAQPQRLLLPPTSKDLSGNLNSASIDECPSSPRRHSSPVSQNYRRVGIFNAGAGDRLEENYIESNSQSFASRLNLAARHPYSSCSPLLLKTNANNDGTTINGINTADNSLSATKGADMISDSATITRGQPIFQQFKCPQPMRKFSGDDQRRISWLRKRSYGDQSVISMKITEDSDDEVEEKDVLFGAAIANGETAAKSNGAAEATTATVTRQAVQDDADVRLQMFKQASTSSTTGESFQLESGNLADRPVNQLHRAFSNEEKQTKSEIEESQVDPRWRHFFDGSTSMAIVAAATVSSAIDRKRACFKRNTTDDSEVERRVAKLLKEIEFSATDSVEDCSKPAKDMPTASRPLLNILRYDSKSSEGTASVSVRARRDSFANKGRNQQTTTSSSSSSQPFSFFASRQLSMQPTARGIEVQTQTEEGLVDYDARTIAEAEGEENKKSPRRSERRRSSRLIQNTSTESSSGPSLYNAPNENQPAEPISGGASRLKFFAKALPQVIAAATSAAAMECNRLASVKNFTLGGKKRKRKAKSGESDLPSGETDKN